MNNFEILKNILQEYVDESIEIKKDSTLVIDLGLNSYELVQIICMAEEEFKIKIPDRIIANFKNVQDITIFIESQVNIV